MLFQARESDGSAGPFEGEWLQQLSHISSVTHIIPITCVAPPWAANMDRMPVPQPTSRTDAPLINEGFCCRASRYASVRTYNAQHLVAWSASGIVSPCPSTWHNLRTQLHQHEKQWRPMLPDAKHKAEEDQNYRSALSSPQLKVSKDRLPTGGHHLI